MRKIKKSYIVLGVFTLISFIIKVILILKYKNLLTVSSDDLNYIKSAVVLLRRGVFVYQNFNEPTVFIMPLYTIFLSFTFKIFGVGLVGMQIARLLQALLSCITIIYIYLIAKKLFDEKVALLSAFFVSFYMPNITSVGYFLTETLFTTLLFILIYYSLKFAGKPGIGNFFVLGIIWASITLCRPTIAFYPIFLFLYLYLFFKLKLRELFKYGIAMLVAFVIIMGPWWVRNYFEYSKFIPLSASSGNPMLQGTYINYEQTPENIVYYKLGENAYETNKIEVETAKKRIKSEFKKDFFGYLKWYTLGKTYLLWSSAFYWKEFLHVNLYFVLGYHYILLLGFIGIYKAVLENFYKYMLPILIILYFNLIHCIYMAFDRYAFPLMPIVAMFSAFFLIRVYNSLKNTWYSKFQKKY